ncbi:MAG: PGF-CTERM sorting domain-containing protein, partial [Methanosarcina sp.]|nr:PGF-CTERM sorting domain-containing protein [Methanosarcina sp.]
MAKKLALIALLAVFFVSAFSVTAFAEEDIEWIEKQDGTTLYWGDTVTVNGYDIKAEDFNDDNQ